MAFATQTAEERATNLIKATAARAAHSAERKASKLRRSFDTDDLWMDLAKRRKLRLPPYGEAATAANLRSFLRKCGVTGTAYEAELGCTLAEYCAWNPTYPLRALAGIALEYLDGD